MGRWLREGDWVAYHLADRLGDRDAGVAGLGGGDGDGLNASVEGTAENEDGSLGDTLVRIPGGG